MKKKTIEHIKFVGEECEQFHANLRVHALEEQAKFEAKSENQALLDELQ